MPSSYDRNFRVTAEVPLPAAVPNVGTITFPYPPGETATSREWLTTGCVLVDSNGNVYTTGFTVSFGASAITVTNSSLGTLPAGKRYRLQANFYGIGQVALDPATYTTDASGNITGLAGITGFGSLLDVTQPSLRRAQIALAKQRTSTSNAKVLFIGDSTTAGLPGDGTYTGRTTSPPYAFTAAINGMGGVLKTNSSIIDPTNTNATNFGTHDSRWTFGANWTVTAFGTFGVRYLAFNNATPANLTFTPVNSCDTYEVYYISAAPYGTVTIASTGATPSTINMSAATAIRKATISVTAGQPLIITPPVSTNVTICGVIGYTAATKEVSVISMGCGGQTSAYFADRTNVYQQSYLIDTMTPDFAVISLGINDWLTGVPTATYSANLQAIITRLAAINCDCALVSPFPSAISNAALATQQGYRDVVQALAAYNNVPYVNVFDQVGSYEISQPLGYYQAAQTVHPSVSGYNLIGYAEAKVLQSMFV